MHEPIADLLKRAMQCKDLGDYKKAQFCLDCIIEADPEHYLAWYEKSKLPIIQEDTITFRNRSISLSVYQKHTLAEKSNYLQLCGFDIAEVNDVQEYLKIPRLVALQRNKYLKMAIRYAPEHERIVYEAELDVLNDANEKRQRTDRTTAIILGFLALPTAIITALSIGLFPDAFVFGYPVYIVITLITPYILSIVGMVYYGKANGNGTTTILGFVCNLIALIVSNLSIVQAIFTFIVK